jgi:hypothetical protein
MPLAHRSQDTGNLTASDTIALVEAGRLLVGMFPTIAEGA